MHYNLNEATDPRCTAIAFILVFLVVVAPLCFVTYAPLLDYPFHIARIYILEHWHESQALRGWYDIRSFLLPNVGMDLVALVLAKIFPVELAGRVFVALTLGLMLSGCVVLHRCIYGHFSLWPLVSSLFLFNSILLFGFLNYLFWVSIMLWAAASWILLSRSAPWLRMLSGTIFSTALFFCHLAALGLYAIIVAGYELQRSVSTIRISKWIAFRDLVVGVSIFVVPLCLFMLSHTANEVGKVVTYRSLNFKAFMAHRTLMSGFWILDNLILAATALFIFAVAFRGKLQVAKSMYLPLIILFIAYLVTPFKALSSAHVDSRLPIAILFVAISSMRPFLWSKALNQALLCGFALLLVFRSTFLSYDWHRYDQIIQPFVTAFAGLPPNSILFAATEAPLSTRDRNPLPWQPPLHHIANLATLKQSIFVPSIWAHPSQQPIAVTSKYAAMHDFQSNDPILVKSATELADITGEIRRVVAGAAVSEAPVFLLILYPELLNLQNPEGTRIIGSGPRFTLLEVSSAGSGRVGST